MEYKTAIFDLDGVLVNTAELHYLAWRELAEELKLPFSKENNELLKGVSRMDSLDIILSLGNCTLNQENKVKLAEKKNSVYVSYLQKLTSKDTLPGAIECLTWMKKQGIKIVLGSSSKNARLIMTKTELITYFDEIIDGNMITLSKPNPEVFVLGAKYAKTAKEDCVVFEDSIAGIKAAKAAGMKTIGIGTKELLNEADIVVPDLKAYLLRVRGAAAYVNL